MEEINDSKTEPVSQTPAPVSEMPKKPKKNNLILVFIFVVMVLALSIGGYWYISNSRLRQNFGGQAPNRSGTGQAKLTPAPTSNTATSPVSSGNWDTSNWKTFTSEEYKYTIKYPVKIIHEQKIVKPDSNAIYNLSHDYFNYKEGALEIYGVCGLSYTPIKLSEMTIADQKTTKAYRTATKGTIAAISRPGSNESICFNFTLPLDQSKRDEVDKLFDQILSTFKFLPTN